MDLERKLCGAKTRQGGKCKKWAMPNGRCRNHGGCSTGRPIIHGRYSKSLPQRLQANYEDALKDPDLISTRKYVAIIDSLVIDKLGSLGEDSQAAMWSEARKVYDELQLAVRTADARSVSDSLRSLGEILQNGEGQAKAEVDIRELLQEAGKLAKIESDRLQKLNNFVTAEQMAAMLAVIQHSINTHVTDKAARDHIARDLIRTLNQEPSGSDQKAS